MNKICLDADFLITSWRLYPPDLFASQWEKLAQHKDKLILIDEIFKEIEPPNSEERKNPELLKKNRPLRYWLTKIVNFTETKSNDANESALKLRKEYQTRPNNIGKGANTNDILLIAYAKINQYTVATFEGYQEQKPIQKSDYKIPLICKLEKVDCINTFPQLLRAL